jgi:AcrR family transcriptional regulator
LEDTPRPTTHKRAAKRERLLAEAARQINAVGAGAIVINDIAERVGLSRNTLYYYVSDRADLVFRCYERACEAFTDDLVAAEDVNARPADLIASLVERQLDFDRPPQAVLSDVGFLPPPQQAVIREQQARNVAALQAVIVDGVATGAFRPCNTEIAAQSLIGMIAWARLSAGWLGRADSRVMRRRSAAAITDIVLNGFASGPRPPPLCDIEADRLTARSFNAFDRRQTNEVKIDQLIAAASRLFNQRGIDGTSLDDVAAMVGATKGAVYHYFDDKADLVTRCYRRAFELYDLIMATATQAGRNGFEKAIITTHLNVQAQAGALSPLMPQPGRMALAEADREAFTKAAGRLRIASTRNVRRGIADGSCRPCDAALVSEMAAGTFLWLPKWLPADYPSSPRQVADATCDVLAFGLQPSGSRR